MILDNVHTLKRLNVFFEQLDTEGLLFILKVLDVYLSNAEYCYDTEDNLVFADKETEYQCNLALDIFGRISKILHKRNVKPKNMNIKYVCSKTLHIEIPIDY